MKNKKSLYILVPLLILVWGLIIQQIVSGVDDSEPMVTPVQTVKNISKPVKDTSNYVLLLDYKDPFKAGHANVVREQKNEAITTNRPARVPKPIKESKPIVWPTLKYGGMVKSSNKKEVGLLMINGRNHLIKKGDLVKGISIINCTKSEVELSYQNEKKTLNK